MVDILLCGCFGHMGKVITDCVANRDDCRIVAGVDINTEESASFPVYKSCEDFDGKADVIIDFSHPNALAGLLRYSLKNKCPAVISTTGLSDEQKNAITEASKDVPLFFSGNMSLGINLLQELAYKAAKVLGDGFDVEIVEMHHNQKIDAPSGTALMLAHSVSSAMEEQPKYEYNRQSKREKRTKNEIGIHSVRGGTIVGEHEIIFAGRDEVIKLSHSAASKDIFAVGAVNAAIFLYDKKPGLYSMRDIVESI